jgi:plasmid stabilization system protein ParE
VTHPIRFTKTAGRQIEEALDWWARNRELAPALLASEIDHAISVIARYPESGIPARSPRLAGVRRVLLPRSHYSVYYRLQGGAVEVIAFWHQQRRGEPGAR